MARVLTSSEGLSTSGGTLTGQLIISVANAAALAVGPNGNTNPTLRVVTNTASAATGLSITSAAAASGLALAVLSSGTNENLTIDSKGSGNLILQNTATGNVGIKATSFGTNAAGVLAIGNGTAPTTSPADAIQIWSADLLGSAGKAGLHIRTEDGVVHSLGSDIFVGATSLTGYDPTATTTRFLSIVRPTATSGDKATLTMVGHSTGDVVISNIIIYNSANADADKRMFQLEAYRDGANNTSKIWIASKSAGTLYSSIQLSGAGDVSLGGDAYTSSQKVFVRSGGLGIGTATFGTSATNTLALLNGTAPSTSPADTVQLYSSDNSAGNTIPSFFCEGTEVLATGQADSVSSVRVKMRINGTVVTLLAV